MYVSRALRLEQYLCSPACNTAVHHWAAWLADGRRSVNSDASRPHSVDPFAKQLQSKTEQELLQLLSQREQGVEGRNKQTQVCLQSDLLHTVRLSL